MKHVLYPDPCLKGDSSSEDYQCPDFLGFHLGLKDMASAKAVVWQADELLCLACCCTQTSSRIQDILQQ